MRPIRLFWWSPTRSPRLLKPELETNLGAWVKLGASTRRPFLNFGDELAPLIVEAVSGRRVKWSPPGKADIVSVGSIFELAGRYPSSAAVWGTGLRGDPGAEVAALFLQNLGNVLAVRGPKTRSALSLDEETPLGDPGLLAERLVKRQIRRGERKVFVPHFTTWNSRGGMALLAKAEAQGFEIVRPSLAPMAVMESIAAASFVMSSSLHGLIVAHSLGVPARLLAVGGRPGREPDWKFMDYFDSIGTEFAVEAWTVFDDARALRQSVELGYSVCEEIYEKAQMLAWRLHSVLQDAT